MKPSEPPMLWKQLSNRQQAFLNIGSSGVKKTTHGRWASDRAINPHALAKRTTKELERDQERARELAARDSMNAAIAAFNGPIKVIAAKVKIEKRTATIRHGDKIERINNRKVTRIAAKAYGADELNRQRAGAMNMGFYKGTGYGA